MSLNVLWIEDEPNSLSYEVVVAEQCGWHITWADTVARGLELLRDLVFELVVIDLILPANNDEKVRGYVGAGAGARLIQLIRDAARRGRTPASVPVLVISASVADDIKAKVVDRLGSARYYLHKPLNEQAYRDVVKELTERLASSPERSSQPTTSADS